MPLCRLLESHGASTLRLPAVEIQSRGDRRALAACLGPLEGFDLIIFTSANAVRFGAAFLEQKRDLTLAAIGPATARALNLAGYRVAVQPVGTTDSEGLLLHPRLEHLAGHRILIIKGSGGRQLLEEISARSGLTFNIAAESNSFEMLRGLVVHAGLISFQIQIGAMPHGNKLGFVAREIDGRDVPRANLVIGRLRGRNLPIATAVFAEALSRGLEAMRSDNTTIKSQRT